MPMVGPRRIPDCRGNTAYKWRRVAWKPTNTTIKESYAIEEKLCQANPTKKESTQLYEKLYERVKKCE